MKLNALEDLFVQEISELYAAETLILKALTKMVKAASHSELQDALADHKKETKEQISRLDRIFKTLKIDPLSVKNVPVSGVLRQGEDLMSEKSSDDAVRDAGLITVAQKVEHYEIAGYGCVRTHAELLGYKEIASLLDATLKEEEAADARLTKLATSVVNQQAARAPYGEARTAARGGESGAVVCESGNGRLFVGLCIGAVVALLLNSKLGDELREQLRDAAGSLRSGGQKDFQDPVTTL